MTWAAWEKSSSDKHGWNKTTVRFQSYQSGLAEVAIFKTSDPLKQERVPVLLILVNFSSSSRKAHHMSDPRITKRAHNIVLQP